MKDMLLISLTMEGPIVRQSFVTLANSSSMEGASVVVVRMGVDGGAFRREGDAGYFIVMINCGRTTESMNMMTTRCLR